MAEIDTDARTLGGCASPEDKIAQLVSLYLSFALDVITEILGKILKHWPLLTTPLILSISHGSTTHAVTKAATIEIRQDTLDMPFQRGPCHNSCQLRPRVRHLLEDAQYDPESSLARSMGNHRVHDRSGLHLCLSCGYTLTCSLSSSHRCRKHSSHIPDVPK